MNPIAVNATLAIIAALVTIGTLNRMNGITDNAIRISVLMIFIGLLAQGLGIAMRQWDHYADTIVYSGIAALAISSRRLPCGIPVWLQKPLVYSIAIAVFVYVLWGVS